MEMLVSLFLWKTAKEKRSRKIDLSYNAEKCRANHIYCNMHFSAFDVTIQGCI